MARQKQIDLKKVATVPIKLRKSRVHRKDFARSFDPAKQPFTDFAASLPRILAAEDLRNFAGAIVRARKSGKPALVMMGAHVIKVGLAPLIVDMMERGIITGVAMNSAAAIHDVEMAMWGTTSEDVEENIRDGSFGMSRETGEFINGTLRAVAGRSDAGYGEALGAALLQAKNTEISILGSGFRLGLPVTVHAAIGTDIIHQQPTMDGAVTGEMSFRDFKVFCNTVKDLRRGGVVMNIGSAVILPEVFLKAVTVARNLGYPAKGFTTANFDMIQHYRPRMNVVSRPTGSEGKGYLFTGHHEIMIPLLFAMVKDKLR